MVRRSTPQQAQPQGDDAAELADFLAEMLDEDMTQPQAQSQVDNRSLQELLLGGETDDAIDRPDVNPTDQLGVRPNKGG